MTKKEMTNELNLRKWAADMADHKASGLSKVDWCKLHGISLSTYGCRCRKVRKALAERISEGGALVTVESKPPVSEPVFAKVSISDSPSRKSGIRLKVGSAEVSIAPDADSQHVKIVMEALTNAK